MGIGVLFRRPLVSLIYGRLSPDVLEASSIYFLITAISYPMLAMYSSCAALFRSVGNSKVTMRVALMVNALNIGGNAFFIYVMKIGVAGAALSTLISRSAAAAILMTMLLLNRRDPISLAGLLRFRRRHAGRPSAGPSKLSGPSRSILKSILNVGIPSGLESSMFQIGRLLTQRIFTSFGTAVIAGNAIASVVNSFSFMPGMAYGMALLTVVGQCVGAGDYEGARKNTLKIMKLSYLTIFVMNLGIYIFMENLVSLFSLSGEAHGMAIMFLRVHCISMTLGWAASFALPNALRAAGDARYVMIVATVSMWTIRVSAAYILSFALGLGPLGVWLAMGGDFLCRGICYISRWRSGKWQEKKVIEV
jgi:putative MATE family efflux protein